MLHHSQVLFWPDVMEQVIASLDFNTRMALSAVNSELRSLVLKCPMPLGYPVCLADIPGSVANAWLPTIRGYILHNTGVATWFLSNPMVMCCVEQIQFRDFNIEIDCAYLAGFLGTLVVVAPTTLRALDIPDSNICTLDAIVPFARSLCALDVRGANITDISPLRNFECLQKLNISGTKVASLDVLSSVPQLRRLRVDDTHIRSLCGLQSCSQLVYLSLTSTMVTDINVLERSTRLRHLYLCGTPISEKGLSVVSSCTQLVTLDLALCRHICDDIFALVAPCQLLQRLNLTRTQCSEKARELFLSGREHAELNVSMYHRPLVLHPVDIFQASRRLGKSLISRVRLPSTNSE